jgi:hypothetical protein
MPRRAALRMIVSSSGEREGAGAATATQVYARYRQTQTDVSGATNTLGAPAY